MHPRTARFMLFGAVFIAWVGIGHAKGTTMFCPECGAEYLAGIEVCADCQIALVATDPRTEDAAGAQPGARKDWRFEYLFSATDTAEVATLTSALEASGVGYYVFDEHSNLGLVTVPARVLVRADQIVEARQILEDLDLATTSNAFDSSLDDELADVVDDEHSQPMAADSRSGVAPTGADGVADAERTLDVEKLACPNCNAHLLTQNRDAFAVHACGSCGGLWLDAEDFEVYETGLAVDLPGARLPPFQRALESAPGNCPRCSATTVAWGSMAELPLGRCSRCMGVFLLAPDDPAE